MKTLSVSFCGLLFALGLGLSGMTQPGKVIAFLDITGAWDPTLAWVMGGAVAVTAITFPRILRRRRSLLGLPFELPAKSTIDAQLLAGAAIFGIGWGLAGYCPGPALASLATATPQVLVFVVAMGAGLRLGDHVASPRRRRIKSVKDWT